VKLPAHSFFIDERAVDDIPLRLVTGLQRDAEVLRKEGLVLTTSQRHLRQQAAFESRCGL
jgi:hypothetical protein